MFVNDRTITSATETPSPGPGRVRNHQQVITPYEADAALRRLTTNHNFCIKTKKTDFVEGQLMGGTAVISYT